MKWKEFFIFVPLGILAIIVYTHLHDAVIRFAIHLGTGQ